MLVEINGKVTLTGDGEPPEKTGPEAVAIWAGAVP
jgi:hypothetical protein